MNEPVSSKIKLGHKVQRKFIRPYLILKSYPQFHTYKLQHCKSKKVYPSLIHANRLHLCRTDRDQFFSRYNANADVVTDNAQTAHDDIVVSLLPMSGRTEGDKNLDRTTLQDIRDVDQILLTSARRKHVAAGERNTAGLHILYCFVLYFIRNCSSTFLD